MTPIIDYRFANVDCGRRCRIAYELPLLILAAVILVAALAVGLLAVPGDAEAQQAGRVYKIGWLGLTPILRDEEAFRRELHDHGFLEGQNLVIERRYSEGREERTAAFATEFVQMKLDLIVAPYSGAAHALKQATSTIPIVMVWVANPDRQGLVPSLARPGGNLTGNASQLGETGSKLLQVVRDALPGVSRVAILWNPDNPPAALIMRETNVPAAKALGMTPIPLEVRDPTELERAFQAVTRRRVEVLYPQLNLWPLRARIFDLAAKNNLPVVTDNREWAQLGALMTYGESMTDAARRAGTYVVKILKGAKPADLPLEQPTKFELVINLKTAKTLGIKIPQSVLVRADQVIQ